jgi:hypothetical protein
MEASMKVNGLMEQRVVKEDFGMQMAIHMKDFGRVIRLMGTGFINMLMVLVT